MKYLFVCGAGVDRSPTAAFVAKQIANRKGLEIEAGSLGLRLVLQNPEFKPEFEKYYKFFVMEGWMAEKIRERGYNGEIVCLDVDDNYDRGESELIELFKRKLEGLV